jgi:hypothetical protein
MQRTERLWCPELVHPNVNRICTSSVAEGKVSKTRCGLPACESDSILSRQGRVGCYHRHHFFVCLAYNGVESMRDNDGYSCISHKLRDIRIEYRTANIDH